MLSLLSKAWEYVSGWLLAVLPFATLVVGFLYRQKAKELEKARLENAQQKQDAENGKALGEIAELEGKVERDEQIRLEAERRLADTLSRLPKPPGQSG